MGGRWSPRKSSSQQQGGSLALTAACGQARATRHDPEARRGHRRRRARRRPALVVELAGVGGEGGVRDGPVVEPGVEAAERTREYARRRCSG